MLNPENIPVADPSRSEAEILTASGWQRWRDDRDAASGWHV